MSNIFDTYNPWEMREIFRKPTEQWPEEFCKYVNRGLADKLLDEWLYSHEDSEYREEVRQIVEDTTYGYESDDGQEMLDFDP